MPHFSTLTWRIIAFNAIALVVLTAGVQVDREDPVRPGDRDEVRDELCRDRYPPPLFIIQGFPILPCIPKIRHHCSDRLGGRAFQSVHDNEQFHEIEVGMPCDRLQNENILSADIL